MKPEHEDPNNHAPKISPDDDWDDLDSFSSSVSARSALPPKRGDHSLPPKKEPKRLHVQRHEPRLKVNDESIEAGVSESPGPPKRDVSKRAAQKKTSKKPAKKATKKAARKNPAMKLARNTVSRDEEPDLQSDDSKQSEDETQETASEDQIRLPAPSDEKKGRLRVNEINPKDDGLAGIQRIPNTTPGPAAKDPKVSKQEEGRQRRRFVRGERSDWGEEDAGSSFRWMIFSGVGILMLVILAVFLSQKGGRKKGRESDKSFFSQLETSKEEDSRGGDDLDTLERLTNSQSIAREMYETFATAKSVDEFTDMLYQAERITPLVLENWQPDDSREGWTPDENSGWSVFDRDGVRYGLLSGAKDDFTEFSAYFREDGSDLKLDWKATVGYGTASFEELRSGEGDSSEIRGWISPSDLYTFTFPEEKYRSYRLVGSRGGQTVWVYVKRDSEDDSKLLKLFMLSQITGESQSEAQVVIELERGPEESLQNQWIIKDLIKLNWLDK